MKFKGLRFKDLVYLVNSTSYLSLSTQEKNDLALEILERKQKTSQLFRSRVDHERQDKSLDKSKKIS